MKNFYGIRTPLRRMIQPAEKIVNCVMVHCFSQLRIFLVRSVNRCVWLSNTLRLYAGKLLQAEARKKQVKYFCLSGYAALKQIVKKSIFVIGSFILRHPFLKTFCLYLLSHVPMLRNKLKRCFCADNPQIISSILKSENLSPRAQIIYELLSKKEQDRRNHDACCH